MMWVGFDGSRLMWWVLMRLSCVIQCLRGLRILRVINLCVTIGLCGVGLALIRVGLVYILAIVLGTK
jgi:hypothetical protein